MQSSMSQFWLWVDIVETGNKTTTVVKARFSSQKWGYSFGYVLVNRDAVFGSFSDEPILLGLGVARNESKDIAHLVRSFRPVVTFHAYNFSGILSYLVTVPIARSPMVVK